MIDVSMITMNCAVAIRTSASHLRGGDGLAKSDITNSYGWVCPLTYKKCCSRRGGHCWKVQLSLSKFVPYPRRVYKPPRNIGTSRPYVAAHKATYRGSEWCPI